MSTTSNPGRRSFVRRAGTALHRHPRVRLAMLLGPPMGWMLVVYLGALALLLLTAFWRQDPLTALVVKQWGLQNFKTMFDIPVYRTIALRSAGIALAVTVTDVVLAFPISYYAARLASPRVKTILLLSVFLPLWSSYLVRAYSWKLILAGNGFLNWTLAKVGLSLDISYSNWGVWLTFCYLWLPFVVLPIYSAMERIPASMIEASSDLGARWRTTFRRVILPLGLPGIVAGSIFSFSLTLGDYIVPGLVGKTQFIGNVIEQSSGVANNLPFAAAYALVPIAVMAVYLGMARRMGAFEAL